MLGIFLSERRNDTVTVLYCTWDEEALEGYDDVEIALHIALSPPHVLFCSGLF